MLRNNSPLPGIPDGTIHRTIGLLRLALNQLDASLDDHEVEKIGVIVHRAMSMQNRSFHTPEHIFDLADPEDGHRTLSAIFHDIVYYQVDNGLHEDIEKVLEPYIDQQEGKVIIREDVDPEDRAFMGTLSVFGFKAGQSLSPFSGLNEFLSALLMNCFLVGTVEDVDLLIATASIEMTIPFRKPDDKGRGPADLLEQRVRETNLTFKLGLTEAQVEKAVKSAVVLANRDILNFADEEPARFLDNTWKLLPESNPDLFFSGLYTIHSYSMALMKMEGFLSHLDPHAVFQRYKDFPLLSDYQTLIGRTEINLRIASLYLGIKMISAGILKALAELSGGDAPVSFFMGEIHATDETSLLSYHLPAPEPCISEEGSEEAVVYSLFHQGRTRTSDFDLQNSPLSLFVYCQLERKDFQKYISLSGDLIRGDMTAEAFLESLPGHLVRSIACAAAAIAFTRKDKLLVIADSY